jgi:hypothetical protein
VNTTDRHDWDRDERQALSGLEDQIDTMQQRHRHSPPFELLRAAQAEVLPPDLQATVSQHVADSAMSRRLAEGLGDDEPGLSAEDQERLLARIMKDVRRDSAPSGAWGWLRPVLLGGGIVAMASLVWMVSRETGEPLGPPERQVVVALPPAAPPFLLPFDKPDVRLSMNALTWRGTTGSSNQLLADLKPGLDAYREGDYAVADRELTALASRYPGTVEIPFYQGISRLFLGDFSGASAAFDAAEAAGDRTFAADISWYRAVAEHRSGNVTSARERLESICNARGTDATRACTALEQIAKATATATPK